VTDGRLPGKAIPIETPEYSADPTAVVEPGATVGARTALWHHARVRAGAVVGTDCVLGQNAFVDHGVVVGDRVKLENNASVHAGVTIGDGVFVGPGAVFTNDRHPRAQSERFTPVPTTVGPGASLGANATVVCGNDIGAHAMVGAGAVVTHPVADHQLVVGNPARHVGWVCVCGHVVSRALDRPTVVVCPDCS
jgi:acetyltransferase-like isoleucine patch superfamily enzyme